MEKQHPISSELRNHQVVEMEARLVPGDENLTLRLVYEHHQMKSRRTFEFVIPKDQLSLTRAFACLFNQIHFIDHRDSQWDVPMIEIRVRGSWSAYASSATEILP